MQNLFKFTLLTLISLTTLNAFNFDSLDYYNFNANDRFFPKIHYPQSFSKVSNVQILGSNYVKIENDIYNHSGFSYDIFNTENTDDTGYFLEDSETNTKYFIFYNSSNETYNIPCQFISSDNRYNLCSRSYIAGVDDVKSVKFSYYTRTRLTKITTCQPNEHFNTETKQCQSCPEGHSWSKEKNKCYKDCSNAKKNMYGWDDGSCTDCSHAKTTGDVYRCFCGGLGLGVPNQATDPGFPNGGKCGRKGACLDGYQFEYTDPECKEDKDPKPDDNSTKPQDPDTPDNPNNPKNPKDPKNPKPNPDNPNPNPDGPKPDPDDSNNEFCKKNPKDPKCKNKDNNNTKPKGPGGGGGGDDDGKDKDAKFNPDDFKYGDIEDMYKDLKGKLQNSVKENEGKFKDLEKGINQLIDNIKGNGLTSFDKQSAPTSCKRSFVVPIYGKSVSFDVDLCKLLEPMRPVVYYVVYVSAFAGGLFLVIKLIIFSF